MILIILLFIVAYSILGAFICYKIGVLDMLNENDMLDNVIGGLMTAFWPITLMAHFLLDD